MVKKCGEALCMVTVVALTALITFAPMQGCALFSNPNSAFVTGVDAGLNTSNLLNQYDAYVGADYSFISDYLSRVDADVASGKLTSDQAKAIHAKADPVLAFNLTPASKQIRQQTSAVLRKLVADAMNPPSTAPPPAPPSNPPSK